MSWQVLRQSQLSLSDGLQDYNQRGRCCFPSPADCEHGTSLFRFQSSRLCHRGRQARLGSGRLQPIRSDERPSAAEEGHCRSSYSPFFGKQLNPDTEVTITTGANEGMLSAFMAFSLDDGDEVIVFEPFFDQYISNIEMPGAKVVYVPMHPPASCATTTSSASEWTIDMKRFEAAVNQRTRMVVLNSPHNPVGKIYSREELQAIGDICVKHNIIILSDEVYDKLYYVPFTRVATLSPEIANITLTVGSGGKIFYATGWRVGWLIGPEHLIKYVSAAHTRICYSSVSPLQEAMAIGFEEAETHNF